MWGTHGRHLGSAQDYRFIPTYVGNSPSWRYWMRAPSVHPHTRGELSRDMTDTVLRTGSSPHTWRTPLLKPVQQRGARFIPTYVGNSIMTTESTRTASVHPHIRGELERRRQMTDPVLGSSPHTWGTHNRTNRIRTVRRFIPTYVGNSPAGGTSTTASTVHPHIRGELRTWTSSIDRRSGSSPHTWGTLIG